MDTFAELTQRLLTIRPGTMRVVNTTISHSLRTLVICLFGIMATLFAIPAGSRELQDVIAYIVYGGTLIAGVLLASDWLTRKDCSRRYSKLIDTFLGATWLFLVTFFTLRSIAMGML
jgi:ABC-type Fe3+ transport system permease subunit